MADGFKKYFNGTTMAGRANVAKATYATLAVVYLLYRVRRKGAPPKKGEEEEIKAKLEDQCSCDSEKPEHPNSYCAPPQPKVAEKECPIHRNRSECCRDDSPPPPPQSPQNDGHRRCPCEDQHRHIDSPKQAMHESHLRDQVDEVHPAREVIGHMQEAASRVLRNVIVAVLGTSQSSGESSCSSPSCSNYESEETCMAHASAAAAAAAAAKATAGAAAAAAETLESAEHLEDDYCAEEQVVHRQRRTAPRSCVPTNASGDANLISSLEESHRVPQSQSQSQQSQSESQSHYRAFNDDFASEIFFEDYDE